MSNHLATVRTERAKYPTPLGFENAWKTINAVAYTHRAEGWGLLRKTGGTQWNQCSVDVLINPRTTEAVDCLGDSEGEGRPSWSRIEYLDDFTSRFVAPTGEDAPPVPPTPPQPPTPPVPPAPPAPPACQHSLTSPNGKFSLSMQSDGNLVIYTATGLPIWASNSAQK